MAVLGHDATTTPPHALAVRGCTLVFQDPQEGAVAVLVGDEVAFGPEQLGLPAAEIDLRVGEALAAVDLAPQADRALATLSGGERQRVAIAAALALRPRLLLLDEPTAHLDERSAAAVLALADRLRRDGRRTVVIAEHRLATIAPLADRLAVVSDGRIVAIGPPRAVLGRPGLAASGVPVPRATQAALALGARGPVALRPAELAAHLAARTLRRPPEVPPPPAAGPVALRLADVRLRYPGAREEALRGVSLSLRRGERVALVGPSGAGKSTLARVAVGLRRPDRGTVEILGRRDPPLSAVIGRVGLLLQDPLHQLLAPSVEAEVALGLRGLPAAEVRSRTGEALERFGLSALRARHPLSLSEGQRRRVTLAAVLARRPDLLVLDEPTLAQDETWRALLSDLIRELAGEGTAILAISHDRELANDACERVVVLTAGTVTADLELAGDPAGVAALAAAAVPLADIPATVGELAARGVATAARSVAELVAAAG